MCAFLYIFNSVYLHKASEDISFSERGKESPILDFTNQFITLKDFLNKNQTHTTVYYTNRKLFLWDVEYIIFPI